MFKFAICILMFNSLSKNFKTTKATKEKLENKSFKRRKSIV